MKKVNVKSASLLFILLFTASIAFSQSPSEYKAKIEALNKEMAKNMLDGLPAIKKASEEMQKKGVKFTSFVPTTLKVIVNGNQITEVGTYKISISMPGMDKPIDDHGKYLTLWEKQKDGSLKVKIETWNSDVDPMSMMNTAEQPKTEMK
jgi:ketosteroid isomerase-like protein